MTVILICISKRLSASLKDSSSILTRQGGRGAGIRYFLLYISGNLAHSPLNNKWNWLAHRRSLDSGRALSCGWIGTWLLFVPRPCLLQCWIYSKSHSPCGPKRAARSSPNHVLSHSYWARNRGCLCLVNFAEFHLHWISLGHMRTPEPITLAKEPVYTGWLSLGYELHCWGQGWIWFPRITCTTFRRITCMEIRHYGKRELGNGSKTTSRYQPASPCRWNRQYVLFAHLWGSPCALSWGEGRVCERRREGEGRGSAAMQWHNSVYKVLITDTSMGLWRLRDAAYLTNSQKF